MDFDCPYCGHEMEGDHHFDMSQQNEIETNCSKCNNRFILERYFNVAYIAWQFKEEDAARKEGGGSMSFDVYLDSPRCNHCGSGGETVYSFNLTHNVNEIVDRCIKGYECQNGPVVAKTGDSSYQDRSWGRLEGWKASDAVPVLEAALHEATDPERRKEWLSLEPSNGWGKLEVVVEVMKEFLAACKDNPGCTIRTSG